MPGGGPGGASSSGDETQGPCPSSPGGGPGPNAPAVPPDAGAQGEGQSMMAAVIAHAPDLSVLAVPIAPGAAHVVALVVVLVGSSVAASVAGAAFAS